MKSFLSAAAAAALVLASLTGCSAGGATTSSGTDAETGATAGTAAPAAAPAWADTKYGTFTTLTQAGTGDSVVALPEGATAGIVTLTHDGAANFIVQMLDVNNQMTTDNLTNTIGTYSGTTAFGMMSLGEAPASIQITADGNWTMTVAPVSTAVELPAGATGDGVFLYSGDSANLAMTHDGAANFIVYDFGDGIINPGLVNEIGAYTGTVPISAGPSVFVIRADGAWTATKA